jgi:hypothetical protein
MTVDLTLQQQILLTSRASPDTLPDMLTLISTAIVNWNPIRAAIHGGPSGAFAY